MHETLPESGDGDRGRGAVSASPLPLPVDLPVHPIAQEQHIDRLPQDSDWGALGTAVIRALHQRVEHISDGTSSNSLIELMQAALNPVEGILYDPAAGTGLALAVLAAHAEARATRLVGQEISQSLGQIASLNLSLQGIPFELQSGDTLLDDRFPGLKADRIALDPPLGVHPSPGLDPHDVRWESVGLTRRADLLWVLHAAHHLAEGGRAAVVSAIGPLERPGSDAHIRHALLTEDLVDAVIALPGGLLRGTNLPSMLLVLERGRGARSGQLLFVDATRFGRARKGSGGELTPGGLQKVKDTLASWRAGTFMPEDRFSAVATVSDVHARAGCLVPNRFVRYIGGVDRAAVREASTAFEACRASLLRSLGGVRGTSETLVQGLGALTLDDREVPETQEVRVGDLLATELILGMPARPEGRSTLLPVIGTRDLWLSSGRLTAIPDHEPVAVPERRTVERNDILFAAGPGGVRREPSPTAGFVLVDFAGPAGLGPNVVRMRPDPRVVHPHYLWLLLRSPVVAEALGIGTSGPRPTGIHQSTLLDLRIKVPSLEVQEAVAAAMIRADLAKAELESALTEMTALEEAVLTGIAHGLVGVAGRG